MSNQLSLFNEESEMKNLDPISIETDLIDSTPINDVEWCYQFFDNEPVVFAFGQSEGNANPLVIQLRPVMEDVLTFSSNGMSFKLFPRPISEESKELRKQQKESKNEG